MKTRIVVTTLLSASSVALAWGCTTVDERLATVEPPPSATPEFVGGDAGPDAEPGLVAYCPSGKCPPGRTTCSSSRFPCDVNLLSDLNNCGACGRACPSGGAYDVFACSNGECVVQCKSPSAVLDCDGIADNGCETGLGTNANCGACGARCDDPANPCVQQSVETGEWGCGCPPGKVLCDLRCHDSLDRNDSNCGACGIRCNRNGPGLPSRANAYYGCANGQCGALKCNAGYGDCDFDVETGCEASLLTDENCGMCGNACPDGQACRRDSGGNMRCMCPAGTTFCDTGCSGGVCTGACVDLLTDRANCGACGVSCESACEFGACTSTCREGLADCDGNPGCEVNTDSDPRNCGACGHSCDAEIGQACVAGQCVVAPCDETTGEVAR